MTAMCTFEIELWLEPSHEHPQGWLSSTLVQTATDADAGTVPREVIKHAELLRNVAGRHARAKVGWTNLCIVRPNGLSTPAHTVWLAEWETGRQAELILDGRGHEFGIVYRPVAKL